jgi:amidohydrolase
LQNITGNSKKDELIRVINGLNADLITMSDFIFDHPEVGFQEVEASRLLSTYLQGRGFELETSYGGLATAFRAIYRSGVGGPHIGLLCEYDAIVNLGHACAHHLQGPSVIGAALAIKEVVGNAPYVLEVIGTPAEESAEGGKIIMLRNGAFKDLDICLMMHGGDSTQTDIRSLALSELHVSFKGVASHSAIAPDKGRSALDAMMLAFNGLAFLRGHVRDDTRIHGVIDGGGQAVNVVPEHSEARIEVRSYDQTYLDQLIGRVMRIFEGAALMTDTTFEVKKNINTHNKIPVYSLNSLLMGNAELAGAQLIMPPRERTGSTDFASVMYHIPGACIRVPFVDKGTPSHSKIYMDQGKTERAHAALLTGAHILAMTALDVIENKTELEKIQTEFRLEKAKLQEAER